MDATKKTTSKTSKMSKSQIDPKLDFMDRFHKDKICEMVPTNTVQRPDCFDVLRPEPGKFIDYNLSQTDIKMDAGHAKIHLTQAQGSYVPPPPGYVFEVEKPKKKKAKKSKYCSMRPET